jgi:hypothetical protein
MDKELASTSRKRKECKQIKNTPNLQVSLPRAAHGRGITVRDTTSESDEDEEERVEWGTCKFGVRMSPAHPRYVGRGNETCGGEVVYTIQEIRTLLRSQPEDVNQWLTTSQMEWALTLEDNEVTNEKDERRGKPVARQLALMISKFIRAQLESEELEGVHDERLQILEEASELDHIWGVWEEEEEQTNIPSRWNRQPSRHHFYRFCFWKNNKRSSSSFVETHASHWEKEWRQQSASLIEQDPEVIPDVDIAVQVGRDFSLMKRSRDMNQAKDMCGSWNTRLCGKRLQSLRSSLTKG